MSFTLVQEWGDQFAPGSKVGTEWGMFVRTSTMPTNKWKPMYLENKMQQMEKKLHIMVSLLFLLCTERILKKYISVHLYNCNWHLNHTWTVERVLQMFSHWYSHTHKHTQENWDVILGDLKAAPHELHICFQQSLHAVSYNSVMWFLFLIYMQFLDCELVCHYTLTTANFHSPDLDHLLYQQ